ncbi:hypothetical protein XU18_2577 [Perkinsela sp. CCAP 1560/4]|nr:hypothetical protein XU18_2577 [Perkinsela sp. CCAP 1560/4]|eukprot:KNH06556.1 hypothetical protein XU18_2577 [Perkinsela sp. CCAP 1560/4]
MIYDVNSPLYHSFLKANIKRQIEAEKKGKNANSLKGPNKVSKPVGVVHSGL